jgi:BirA family biotin operon repressor/biotin-[acetyl-CoA-carboxylase] ligase
LGQRLVELAECDSTSDEAAALAAAGAPHGTVVVAAAQRRGRGRLGRDWYSPPGENLYLSCILRPELSPGALPPVTLAAGVAVAEAVAALDLQPRLKWPNDVLSGARKLGGILTEMTTRANRVDAAVLGIGINANSTRFPPALGRRTAATSLAIELGGPVDLIGLRGEVLARLEVWLDLFFRGGLAEVAPSWLRWSRMAGQRVQVVVNGRAAQGIARGLDPSGGLDVELDRGQHVTIVAGDVTVLAGQQRGGPTGVSRETGLTGPPKSEHWGDQE